MINFDLVGYIAGAMVAASLIPQVMKSWKTKSTKDLSMRWTLTYIAGLLLWIVYGFGISSMPLILMIFFEFSMAVSLLILKLKYG